MGVKIKFRIGKCEMEFESMGSTGVINEIRDFFDKLEDIQWKYSPRTYKAFKKLKLVK